MTNEARISFRGVLVVSHWPERIREAQNETTWIIGGVELPRVRYGDEEDDWEPTTDRATTAP